MDLQTQQILNEYTFDKRHTVETIRDSYNSLAPEVNKYIKLCEEYFSETDFSYVLKDGTKKNWDTKEERFNFIQDMSWNKFKDLCWEVVVWSTIKPMVTFTEVVGHLYKKLAVTTDRQGIESAADFIALLNQTPFIEVIYPMDAEEGVLMIKSNVELDEDMKEYLSNQRYILPSLVPPVKVKSNTDTGYESITGSVILSGNHHDLPIALDHINRQNSVALELEPRVLRVAEPIFKDKIETDKEREERYASFKQCNVESISVYSTLMKQGNHFYLTNKFDEGGRTYAQGYHANPQGDNYRKSALVLANKEIIEIN